MTKLGATVRLMGLALVVSLAQACQKTEQPATETAGDAGAPAASPKASSKPAAAPAPAPAPKPLVLDAGTVIKVRPSHTLSTKTLKTGDGFDAVLEEPLVAGGREVFPKGSMVMGKVVESDPGGRVKGVASLSVTLNMLHTPDGKMYDVATNTVSVQAKTTKTKDAEKVAIGTAVGAAIGAIAGGGKGAGIGAATGAGAGTGVVLATRGDPAEIPSETVLQFSLNSPVTVSP
jgi:hypothetical protein